MQVDKLRPMWHKPEGWEKQTPSLNAWVQDLPTWFLKQLWDLDLCEADPGCFLAEAIHMEMNYRGEGSYVAI